MSDTLHTLGLTVLAQEYRGDIIRQVNRKVVLLRLLDFVAGSGKNCAFATEADGQIAENYSEGADASNFGSDLQASATLNWGLYRANFHLSELAMDGAASTATPAGNHALWARNLVNASAKLASTVNGVLYTGAGTGSLVAGLGIAIAQDANTYAGIDRTVGANAYWKPYVVDPGVNTALTLAQIRTDIAAVYTACGMNPDIAMVSPAVFNTLVGLFDATRRYMDIINTPRGAVTLDAGYKGVEVDGVIFIKDKDMTANAIYYLNWDHVKLQYLPGAAERAMLAANVQLGANDGFGEFPLGFRYHMLAKNGPSERAEVLSTLQLVVDRPNTCGARLHVL